jgi:hypothetical protein
MDTAAMSLFRELADRSPSEREAYYVRHRVPDAVRAEVESLIRFDGDTAGGLRGQVAAAADAVLAGRTALRESARPLDGAGAESELVEGRFPPGTLLAGRYRVVSLVGRGGMGEVYRAHDLTLKQAVALKFLPASASGDPRRLARFHGEVRLARQISHPNVCRVYDIGDVDGLAYISMEYIDGEDLATLLRRIGRLPPDKALEIARRLCAGLAAAHDKGVVHRDLKPGNVMIDSRGQVFITDFGLSATTRSLAHADVRSGTPAYMAPEQLDGREVTPRSDLYALGLVLYEMFSGRPPFPQRRTASDRPPRLDSVARDVDAGVARAIERCLEPEPRDRPSSALAVAASLPGGNPLAEALAAGVTPSPQMVAAAQWSDALSVRTAVVLLAIVLVALPAMVALGSRVSLLQVTPFPYAPEVLEQKAREIVAASGYPRPPRDRHRSFFWNRGYKTYSERSLPPAEYRAQLAAGQPSIVSFRYRQSDHLLLYFDPGAHIIDEGDPPLRVPGDAFVSLDLHGRLRHLEVVLPVDGYAQRGGRDADWGRLFAAAGLEPGRFMPAEPGWIPPVTFDARAAWTGTLAHAPSAPMRVEAAAWRGRPVYFRFWDDTPAAQAGLQAPFGPKSLASVESLFVSWIVAAGAALVGWRNYAAGRSDVRGAVRSGAAVFTCSLVAWGLTAHHVPSVLYVVPVFTAFSAALTFGMFGGVLYLAVEPYVRRRWPASLISWTRLLSGRFRDPLVGGHVLVGCAFGIGLAVWSMLKMAVLLHQGLVSWQNYPMLSGPGWVVHSLLWHLTWWSLVKALAFGVLLLFAKVLLRREWLAMVAAVLLANVIPILEGPHLWFQAAFEVPAAAIALWLLIRWGVLPMMVASFISEQTTYTPLTTDLAAPYSEPTLIVLATVLVLSIWSFSVSLAGRPLFEDAFGDQVA